VNRIDLTADYPDFALRTRAEWDAPCTALFGASGAGKTTILEAICGLRPEVTGAVVLGGQRVDLLPAHERALGWVPQDAALFPHMSARENIEFSLRFRGSAQAAKEAIVALELDGLLERRAVELSGQSYVDNMIKGLRHWVDGADREYLAWGIMDFRRPA
jgi:molybdate transport system ATP-binding protein